MQKIKGLWNTFGKYKLIREQQPYYLGVCVCVFEYLCYNMYKWLNILIFGLRFSVCVCVCL